MNTRDKEMVNIVIDLFAEKGSKFKMDDVASAMKISKKTIYAEYGNKEALIILVVKAVFEGIEHRLETIIASDKYNTLEKLIYVTCAFPDVKDIDYHKAIMMKDDFPKPYDMFIHYIEDNWNMSRKLYNQCIEEGYLKPVDHEIYRLVVLGVTKQVLSMDDVNQEELLEKCVRQAIEGFSAEK